MGSITTNEWFAAELKDRCDELGLTPREVMLMSRVKEHDIDACIEGRKLPGLFSLVLLAEYLECTVNDLLGFEEIEENECYEKYLASAMFINEGSYALALAGRVHRYFEDNDIVISKLAAELDYSDSTIHRWFSKHQPILPKTPKFIELCRHLGVTPTELLGY